MKYPVLIAICLLSPAAERLSAGPIDFSDYRLLDRGMSEAEVLMRVGKADREMIIDDDRGQKKIWYYRPEKSDSWQFTTIITIGAGGRVIDLQRERP